MPIPATAAIRNVLDLRPARWTVIAELFGLERADYPEGTADHELYWELASVFAAHGHDWAVFTIGGQVRV